MPGLKPDLIDYLEKKREEELAERKEKSQKQSEEASKEKSNNTSIGWEAPQYMEVTAHHYRQREGERECMHAMAFINYLPKSVLRDISHQLEVKLTPMHMNLLFF